MNYSSSRNTKKEKGTVKDNVFKSKMKDEVNNLSFSALKVATDFTLWTRLIYNSWKEQIREHEVSQGFYKEVISFTRQITLVK